jgi:hypothetical protein
MPERTATIQLCTPKFLEPIETSTAFSQAVTHGLTPINNFLWSSLIERTTYLKYQGFSSWGNVIY